MKDGYNRKISYMRLSVTQSCNFRCKYCMPDNIECTKSAELSFDKMYDICHSAVKLGVEKIRITGGEPLIRKDIVDFCQRVSSINGLRELTMTTNGSLLSEYAFALKEAGVRRLNISLDTLSEEKFKKITSTDNLYNVLDGIKTAEKAGFDEIKINVVLIGGFNTDEIADFVNLTEHNNYSIRFIELMPIGECSRWDKSSFVSADDVLKAVPQLKRINVDGVAQTYKIDGYKGTVGLIRPMSDKFCDMCNRIRVTADGKLKTCLHSSDEYDLSMLSGVALENKIKEAILNKPSGHKLTTTCFSETSRFMNQIGG